MPLPNIIVACILASCAAAYTGFRLYSIGYQRALKDLRETLEDERGNSVHERAHYRQRGLAGAALFFFITSMTPCLVLGQVTESRSSEQRQADLEMILSALETNPDSIMALVANGWQPPINGRRFLWHYRERTGDVMHQAYPDSVFDMLLYPPKTDSVLKCEAAYLMAADVFRRAAVFSAVDVLMERARECAEGEDG